MRSSFKAPVTNLESIIALILFLLQGGGHSPPDQGEQLGPGLEGRPDLGRGRQQQRPAGHLPARPGGVGPKVIHYIRSSILACWINYVGHNKLSICKTLKVWQLCNDLVP